jgi:16S rRNA (cytidine1402-2'-O)-methyltransferase
MPGILFVVGTPIGNLGDLSPRARETLAQVSLVAAEDTRRSGRLLAGIGVRVPMLSFFEGNERQRVP